MYEQVGKHCAVEVLHERGVKTRDDLVNVGLAVGEPLRVALLHDVEETRVEMIFNGRLADSERHEEALSLKLHDDHLAAAEGASGGHRERGAGARLVHCVLAREKSGEEGR